MPPTHQHEGPLPPEGNLAESFRVTHVIMDPYPKLFLEGHPFPIKGNPTREAVAAINVVKKLVPFLWIRRLRVAAMMALYPHILKPEYMLPASRELRRVFGEADLSLIASHIVEYDSAYRVRFQKMAEEGPSLWKMLRENRRNDYIGAHRKIRLILLAIFGALLIPSFRRSWRRAWEVADHTKLCMDAGDVYWFLRRTDYGPNNPNRITDH